MAIFFAARVFFKRRMESVWLANAFALAMLVFCVSNLTDQMEVTLTLPLGMAFLLLLDRATEEISARSYAAIGFLASLLVLSRLDAALLVGLCGLVALLLPAYRRAMTWTKVLAFIGGFAPLMMTYLIVNEVFFHRLTPISGASKELRISHAFNLHPRFSDRPMTEFLFVVAFLVLFYVAGRWKKFANKDRVVYTAAALFPFVHWGLVLSVSDWRIWPWYSYSLRFALLCGFAIAGNVLCAMTSRRRIFVGPALFAFGLLALLLQQYKPVPVMVDVAAAARAVSAFAESHPGRYAMGDRAGMLGYLNSQPTLQTEGLVMDNTYLAHVRNQDPLRDVLKLYHVDYYVGFSEKRGPQWRPLAGCFQAREPAQAGPNSDAMRAVFCERPSWELLQNSGQTLIFDLRPKP